MELCTKDKNIQHNVTLRSKMTVTRQYQITYSGHTFNETQHTGKGP